MVICLERDANDLHLIQLMPLSPVISCSIKVQIGLTLLVLAYPGCPGKEAVKWVSVSGISKGVFQERLHVIGRHIVGVPRGDPGGPGIPSP